MRLHRGTIDRRSASRLAALARCPFAPRWQALGSSAVLDAGREVLRGPAETSLPSGLARALHPICNDEARVDGQTHQGRPT
jgi:hypothetical protein